MLRNPVTVIEYDEEVTKSVVNSSHFSKIPEQDRIFTSTSTKITSKSVPLSTPLLEHLSPPTLLELNLPCVTLISRGPLQPNQF